MESYISAKGQNTMLYQHINTTTTTSTQHQFFDIRITENQALIWFHNQQQLYSLHGDEAEPKLINQFSTIEYQTLFIFISVIFSQLTNEIPQG